MVETYIVFVSCLNTIFEKSYMFGKSAFEKTPLLESVISKMFHWLLATFAIPRNFLAGGGKVTDFVTSMTLNENITSLLPFNLKGLTSPFWGYIQRF